MFYPEATPCILSMTKLDSSTDQKQAWWEWHKANPHVWNLFERFALEAARSGRKNFSHWLIMNRIRWETAISTTSDDFKIRNDYIAYYARLFMAMHPKYEGFFRTKKMKGESEIEQQ